MIILSGIIIIALVAAVYYWFIWRPYNRMWKKRLDDLKLLHKLEDEAFDEWERQVFEEIKRRRKS